MKKGGGGLGGVSSIKPKNYTTVLLSGSGAYARSLGLLFPLSMPLGRFLPCGHHLWGTEKNDRCVKKLAYISVVLGATLLCVGGVRE